MVDPVNQYNEYFQKEAERSQRLYEAACTKYAEYIAYATVSDLIASLLSLDDASVEYLNQTLRSRGWDKYTATVGASCTTILQDHFWKLSEEWVEKNKDLII